METLDWINVKINLHWTAKKQEAKSFTKTIEKKILYFHTLFFSWMLLDALDSIIGVELAAWDLSNPKEREVEIKEKRSRSMIVIWRFSWPVRFLSSLFC